MLRTAVLTAFAFGVIVALSGATWMPGRHAHDAVSGSVVGPTLAADLGELKQSGPYLHVEATFLRAQSGDAVKVLPIALREGEHAAFSIPGFPEQTFRFERAGNEVLVEVKTGRSILARLLG